MRKMTSGTQTSNLKIVAFLFKGSISDPFTPYNLNIIGLLLTESLSMLVLLSGYRAFAKREGQIMSPIPCLVIAIEATLILASAFALFVVNKYLRDTTSVKKVVPPVLAISAFGPIGIGLLVVNAILTRDIGKTACYSGEFCKQARIASGCGWALLAIVTFLLSLWIFVVRNPPPSVTDDHSPDLERTPIDTHQRLLLRDNDDVRKPSDLA